MKDRISTRKRGPSQSTFETLDAYSDQPLGLNGQQSEQEVTSAHIGGLNKNRAHTTVSQSPQINTATQRRRASGRREPGVICRCSKAGEKCVSGAKCTFSHDPSESKGKSVTAGAGASHQAEPTRQVEEREPRPKEAAAEARRKAGHEQNERQIQLLQLVAKAKEKREQKEKEATIRLEQEALVKGKEREQNDDKQGTAKAGVSTLGATPKGRGREKPKTIVPEPYKVVQEPEAVRAHHKDERKADLLRRAEKAKEQRDKEEKELAVTRLQETLLKVRREYAVARAQREQDERQAELLRLDEKAKEQQKKEEQENALKVRREYEVARAQREQDQRQAELLRLVEKAKEQREKEEQEAALKARQEYEAARAQREQDERQAELQRLVDKAKERAAQLREAALAEEREREKERVEREAEAARLRAELLAKRERLENEWLAHEAEVARVRAELAAEMKRQEDESLAREAEAARVRAELLAAETQRQENERLACEAEARVHAELLAAETERQEKDRLAYEAEAQVRAELLAAETERQEEERLACEAEAARLHQEFLAAERERLENERLACKAKREARIARRVVRQAKKAHKAQAKEEAARDSEVQAEQEAARQIEQVRAEALKAEAIEREAAFTTQHVVLGSTLITCGAGIDIRRVISGFESCCLLVKALPQNTKHAEIVELFTAQGVDPENLFVETRPIGTHLEARILTDAVHGRTIASELDGIDFKGETLRVEVTESTAQNAMGQSSGRDCDLLTITWPAPSVSMTATYTTMKEARTKVQTLDRTMFRGRRIRVALDRPPAGQVHKLHHPESVKISNLGIDTTIADVARFAGTEVIKLARSWNYNMPEALQILRHYVEEERGSFELIEDGNTDNAVIVQSRFATWEEAKQVRDAINKDHPLGVGYPRFRITLLDPMNFVILIPRDQYNAQKRIWDALAAQKNDNGCHLSIQADGTRPVFIRLAGDDRKVVGALKVRIETLAAGEKLDATYWHRSFASRERVGFFARVLSETGVYVRSEWKTHTLRLYGDKKDDARRMITDEVARFARLEWDYVLERRTVGYFVRKGLAEFKEIIGDDFVTLDLSTRRLIVRGGEEARHTLNRLLSQAHEELRVGQHCMPEANNTCPICYDEVAHPVQLGCGHVYCTACIRHYLVSAPDTKIFPLVCMGNEARCRVAMPIPVIQRFLTQEEFFQVVDIAFSLYLGQNSKEFRYCTTPDCTQIYRCNTGATQKCPSCFAEVCSSCHQEAHEGMTCQELKDRKQAEEEGFNEEWATSHGMKRCPSCQTWIEKSGCNHTVTCRCGVHICWECMKICAPTEIYKHLRTEHGGAPDEVTDDRQAAIGLQRQFMQEDNVQLGVAGDRPVVLGVQPQRLFMDQEDDSRPGVGRERRPRGRNIVRQQHNQNADAQAARQLAERAAARREAERAEAARREMERRETERLEAQHRRDDEGGGCVVM